MENNYKKTQYFLHNLWNLLFKFNLKEMNLARQVNKCPMISEKSLLRCFYEIDSIPFQHQEGQL